jgi:hypothetical protein
LSAPTTTGGSWSFGVAQNTLYQFYVRSWTARGLASAWNGPIRVGIGHPQQIAQRWAQRSRGAGASTAYNLYNGTVAGSVLPGYSTAYGFATGVVVTDVQYNITSPSGFGETEGFFRECFYLWNGTAGSPEPAYHFQVGLPSGTFWAAHPARGNWSNGGPWGIWLRGSGYDDKYGVPPIQSYCFIWGTEYYAELEDYVSVAHQDNYYW